MEAKCESYKYINSKNQTSQMENGGPNVILEPVGNAGSYLFSSESDVAEFVGKFKRLNSESRC